jgi:hypothetical protein
VKHPSTCTYEEVIEQIKRHAIEEEHLALCGRTFMEDGIETVSGIKFNLITNYSKCEGVHYTESLLKEGGKIYNLYGFWGRQNIDAIREAKQRKFRKTYYARKLQICADYCSKQDLMDFTDLHHAQGATNFSLAFSLITKEGEIIQSLQFRRYSGDSSVLEISRNITKSYVQVVGGFQRLLTHAIRTVKTMYKDTTSIITFALKDLTPDPEDSVYIRAGFTFKGDTAPMLFFEVKRDLQLSNGSVFHNGVHSRQSLMKHKLIKFNGVKLQDGEIFEYNAALTANENLKKLGIYPFHISGNWKYELKIK